MRLTLSSAFPTTHWPGPLAAGRPASAGEEWLGPSALLERLELCLGIPSKAPSGRMRAASALPALRAAEGFWSRSLEVDPLATARRLLFWRDGLALEGWRGDAGGERLESLSRALDGAPPGAPDRLARVIAALSHRRLDIDAIDLLEPRDEWPLLWRRVLDALERRGVAVRERAIEPVAARGDLGAARRPPFTPTGDGSLTLLRAQGPLAAADEVAAWLASLDDTHDIVIVGPEPILDQALRRHGLPTTGAPGPAEDCAALAVLPLALAVGLTPPDPRRVAELLAIEDGPVPRALVRPLERALSEWPAVDSDLWRTTLAGTLAAIDDEARRGEIAARFGALLAPAGTEARYPASAIASRLDALEGWLQRRLERHAQASARRAGWRAALRQIAALRDLLSLARAGDPSWASLARLCAEATEEAGAPSRFPSEAGLASVDVPGAVAGPAARIVWWSFTRDADAAPVEMPLSPDERAALGRAGILLPDRGRAALARARLRRRPLLLARDALLLVCPSRLSSGEEAFPHPLWDEVAAALPERGLARRLLSARAPSAAIARPERPLRPAPGPRRLFRAPPVIPPRPEESPHSLSQLLGCPLAWALERRGGIGAPSRPPGGPLVLGKLAHALLERTLAEPPLPAPASAAARIEGLFDSDAPRLVAALFLRGAEAARAGARRAVSGAAAELARLLAACGRPIAGFEVERSRAALGATLGGRVDLLLGPPDAIVDFKWGGGRHFRATLATGTALQLAAYAHILGDAGGAPPPAAYFVVLEGRLLTTDARAFPGAERVDGPGMAATWAALAEGIAARRRQIDGGILEAPGNPDEGGEPAPRDAAVIDGRLTVPPGCRFCALDGLCGRRFDEEAA